MLDLRHRPRSSSDRALMALVKTVETISFSSSVLNSSLLF